MSTDSFVHNDYLSNYIWEKKYKQKSVVTDSVDANFSETARRVTSHVYRESKDDLLAHLTCNAIEKLELLPGGRILAAAGTARDATLINTFMIDYVSADPSNISDLLAVSAKSMLMGGGIGVNLSLVPPSGENCGANVLRYMDLWHRMALASSSNFRQPAMLLALDVSHPEIESFIDAKRSVGSYHTFNASVLVPDDFIMAARRDENWCLRFPGVIDRQIKARQLWNKLLRASYETAEPGVIFIDTVNRANPMAYCETIAGTNSCAEQPLPPFGAVPLTSINLSAFVDPSRQTLDLNRLIDATRLGVHFLDRVLDTTLYPSEHHSKEARLKRRIGLGVTGLADALAYAGYRYGSKEACDITIEWLSVVREAAYRASADRARYVGCFPAYDAEQYLASPSLIWLPPDLRRDIQNLGCVMPCF